MKKHFLLFGAILFGVSAFAQQAPTNTAPAGAGPSGQNSAQYWSRAGNNNVPVGNTNNIFGTLWNSPIYTRTNSANRTKLNSQFTAGGATAQYAINGYGFGNTQQTVNTSGYMLLGVDGNSITNGQGLYNNKGAFSLLHLNGTTASNQYQEFGYRPWMKTGITFTGNRDLSYMGLRAIGDGEDITETTIAWSDNNNAVNPGPDDMVFRFTSGGGAPINYNTDFSSNTDLDGLHVSRFTGNGLMGLGNTFGINVGVPAGLVYNTPRSLLHMSYQYRAGAANQPFGFMQITYRRENGAAQDTIGQGEQATDGLRLGIDNNVFGGAGRRHLNSYLRWQEASSFIIQTEDNNTPNIDQNERMRITSIGALNRNYTTGQYNGLTTNENVTRVAISHQGNAPLTRPKSLLHIGYDYGNPPFASIQGYRQWMDLGMLVSNSRDHVWLGLLPRDTVTTTVTQLYERDDAVLAWGTDRNVLSPEDVDKMRFVFTGSFFGCNTRNITF